MKAITAQKMKKIDQAASRDFKIPSLILMENAGRQAAGVALEMLSGKNKKVICVCGKGNNGGDGFVCIRHLMNKGIKVDLFLTGKPKELKGDAKINFLILKKMNASIHPLTSLKDFEQLKKCLKNTELVVDAIFGIGVSGLIKEPYCQIIEIINQSKQKILAMDIPSGLDANKGIALGSCVKADKTVTFAALKIGLKKKQGPYFSGKIIIADISIPRQLLPVK